jgi:hypothetical protein
MSSSPGEFASASISWVNSSREHGCLESDKEEFAPVCGRDTDPALFRVLDKRVGETQGLGVRTSGTHLSRAKLPQRRRLLISSQSVNRA